MCRSSLRLGRINQDTEPRFHFANAVVFHEFFTNEGWLRETSRDRCWVSVVQFGVRLHFSDCSETAFRNQWIDVSWCQLDIKIHEILPVLGPNVFYIT